MECKAKALETKQTPAGSTFYRVPCACGWVGAWWLAAPKAKERWQKHARAEADLDAVKFDKYDRDRSRAL